MTLTALLDEHGEEICADFLSEYHFWLPDVIAGESEMVMDAGSVLSLIRQLPQGSRFKSVTLEGGEPGWSRDRILLLDIANHMRAMVNMYQRLHSKTSPPAPVYWEVPGVEDPTTIKVDEVESLANEQAFLEERALRLARQDESEAQ